MFNAMKYRKWGVQFDAAGDTRFRIWAPGSDAPRLVINGAEYEMRSEGNGWYEAVAADVSGGATYHFVLPDGREIPDPASHWQEGGLDGPSTIIDHDFAWRHENWTGRPWHEAVIYEIHIGTFTEEGTFRAAEKKLERLAELGITVIEVMPLASFQGDRGWGYDGDLQFAPQRDYGSPDDLKAFIDAAHGLGMMVLLDVVYNHFGPEGNFLQTYAPDFFQKNETPWGPAPDFDSVDVRSYFLQNALYWLQTYRFDGLRIDAADHLAGGGGEVDFLTELAQTIRYKVTGRHVYLVIEDARNTAKPMTPEEDAPPLVDAQWNDDFHHVVHVMTTGEDGGLYQDFVSDPESLLRRSLATGFVYQGDPRPSRDFAGSGERSDHLSPQTFVNFLHNHDQAGNRLCGERLRALLEPALFNILECILLLSPQTPLMFMGDDHASTQPFYFFSDHPQPDREAAIKGRLRQAEMFQGALPGNARDLVQDPNDVRTRLLSTLNWRQADEEDGRRASEILSGLLAKRRQYVWPLLASEFGGGTALGSPARTLAIDWAFAAGRLQLRANLSDAPADLPPVEGEIFHRLGDIDGQTGNSCSYSVLFAVAR
ncbi:UNVERIFIED_ORG: maltooligosyltrehalose trehalohydrolase [Rhizobium sp. SORGH_AS260]|uniref:malto-oligosyltrehalose trehalohydrolase n=1 Tax=Agrobacterium sp. SORGH_AS_0440 TaxID=3041757 RepID=UPI002782F050|nr:malto-oligosyltrehalose trehalohydrolase [Agrobacterium sp. SORGH_AS_0440]MDP9730024.1 maltooligosyltrehalose trehalohydrolase [Rhizobium sp. SORGH_AS_0285]MDP9753921.1 maltooligosyltrehalose trehalohydrolase [Rhizobium sp. SORGH_AS_0260]MDR6080898.1 maltooligosyltrehalose trehalohydrolase [Agrobacterium sp. SORGH_AS_0440]